VLKKREAAEKICVITGATSGVGRAAAFQFSTYNTKLILLSRNKTKGSAIVSAIRERTGEEKADFIQADISNLEDVTGAVRHIKEEYKRIDILINNAGARFNAFLKSAQGIELTFATNHLGHFLLTQRLLDLLALSPDGRIINVSSSAHCGYTANFDYIGEQGVYDRKAAYGRSKLANLLFTYELARRLAGSNILVNAVHPGIVATGFARNNGLVSWAKHCLYHFVRGELIMPVKAAKTIIYLALSDDVKGVTGKYFFDKKQIKSSDVSYDINAAQTLWDLSMKLCGSENINCEEFPGKPQKHFEL